MFGRNISHRKWGKRLKINTCDEVETKIIFTTNRYVTFTGEQSIHILRRVFPCAGMHSSVYPIEFLPIRRHPCGWVNRASARNKCWKIRQRQTQYKRQRGRPVRATIALSSNSLFGTIVWDLRLPPSARVMARSRIISALFPHHTRKLRTLTYSWPCFSYPLPLTW